MLLFQRLSKRAAGSQGGVCAPTAPEQAARRFELETGIPVPTGRGDQER